MTAWPTVFLLAFQPPLFRVKIKNKSHFQLVFEPVFFLSVIFQLLLCYDCPLAGNIRRLVSFFLLFDSVSTAVTTYNVGVFKPTAHDLSNSSMSSMFLALQKFALKDDKLELKYHM